MAFKPFVRGVGALTLLLAVSVLPSCSKSDDGGTAPPVKELDSGPIAGSGGLYSHLFNTAGTFSYHCAIHNGMNGNVQVDASSPNTNMAVTISGNAFSPANTSVKPGGTVTWTNTDITNHTVTSN